MFNRINPYEIIVDHYKTFYNYETKKLRYPEIAFHTIFPLLIGIVLAFYFKIDKDAISNIIVAFSIACGFLFSLMIPLCDLSVRLKEQMEIDKNDEQKNYQDNLDSMNNAIELAEELFYNVSFALLLCLASVFVSILLLLELKVMVAAWSKIIVFVAYPLYIMSLLTILVVIQRVFKVFKFRLNIKTSRRCEKI